ncbi:hypothetical protein FK220_000120 [Flavobacteriaceae bacterium TP-CH-4]|uniref:Cardiolipin synthetase n=1 Tax=Pelagihabitans pacificus TaxID=2696054 RepID=A0A967E556_9FLAO|nr:hypothetical protein [Pelagihabitans pacificus]NHF57724.1 hypothetical protein [Pelagihabitans pacificus]
MKKRLLVLLLVLLGCSSVSLVENWKNPDIAEFDANKVLVIGMTQSASARLDFENKLKKEFLKRGVKAERSIDLFEDEFTNTWRSEEELRTFETWLLDQNFDAILLTKVVGSETKQAFRKSILDLDEYYGRFRDDYIRHQEIYYDENYYEEFQVYHAETSLYCICEGEERSLIWRGAIDITDPKDVEKTVNDYVKLVVLALKEQNLILKSEDNNEITGL